MPLPNYTTLVDALKDLKDRGYTLDFKLKKNCIALGDEELLPGNFTIQEVHRFEGMTNPADMSILYALEAKDGRKGTLVHAYGPYAEALDAEMVKALKYDPNVNS